MSLKKKAALSMASIGLGAMALMGGTFAYFSDSVDATSKFTNGTIVLKPDTPMLEKFNITGWKPGDTLVAEAENKDPAMILKNEGTLPMNVFMNVDARSDHDTHKSIVIESLKFGGADLLAAWGLTPGVATLADLQSKVEADSSTTVNGNIVAGVGKYIGFLDSKVGTTPKKAVTYKLKFKDTGKEQNSLQGDITSLGFKFTGLQYDGITYNLNNLSNATSTDNTYTNTNNLNDRPVVENPTPEITLTNTVLGPVKIESHANHNDLIATVTFKFSDNSEVNATETKHNVEKGKSYKMTFSVVYLGKTYTKEIDVQAPNN
ncbi:TasA family protein [Bacillus sp. FJAT-27245]|uniref:TasA family protein n=1 Tax=Bacillus sp. FJAT-27245 TaxID=1684144 RepID=UPI0006A77AAD|nr:TasA family protein [Bacillus sp. FJAT-27245]